MKALQEVFIGAIVFMVMDRLSRVVSTSIINKANGDDEVTQRSMLRIELFTLFVSLFIAIQVGKF
jgi:hypothetical protein